MEWSDVTPLLELVLPLALAWGWRRLKPYLDEKAESDKREAAIRELDAIVEAAVAWRSQTEVDSLKSAGEFDAQKQLDSRIAVVVAALNNLSPSSYSTITKHYGKSVEDVVTLLLEKHVSNRK